MADLDLMSDEVEFVEIELDAYGEVMPSKNDLVAVIDADTIAYATCCVVEEASEVLSKDFYTDEEYEEIINSPSYCADTECLYTTDPIIALQSAEDKLKKILEMTGCQTYELHFTGGKENFRYSINPKYKGNRTVRTPAGLWELKQNMCKKLGGVIHTMWEADDAVINRVSTDPKTLLVAVDKDVLNSVAGRHFNYYESAKYNIDMKFVETDKYTARTWKYMQALMGDPGDNITGVKGIGKVKAAKILELAADERELFSRVVEAFKKSGKTEQDAIDTLNMVDMFLLHKNDDGQYEIKLRDYKEYL